MCSKPKVTTPKAPDVSKVRAPAPPEQTAQEIGRSATASKNGSNPNTLGKFDLRLPPSLQIPS